MPKYNDEFKEQVVRKMMPPNAMSVAQVSRDTGVSDVTLYNWRNQFRHEGKSVPADPSNPENWSGENKLAVVIETAALNEEELAEYCRQKGLYVEQIVRLLMIALMAPPMIGILAPLFSADLPVSNGSSFSGFSPPL